MKRIRLIKSSQISKTVAQLCIKANLELRKDVLSALQKSLRQETSARAKNILKHIIKNASLACKNKIPLCQDTGMAVVFVEAGQDVHIIGGNLLQAINKGVSDGYKKGYLRSSVIDDPLIRKHKNDNSPAVIHFNLVKGEKMKITVLPQGFGCENVGQVRMFRPTDSLEKIKEFIINTVKAAGPNACPPFIVGIGIGGTQDKAAVLAKEALLRPINRLNSKSHLAKLEKELLTKINKLNLGPMGLGGRTTAIGVNVLTYPTHMAGLPVAVHLSCHSLRSATKNI